MGNICCKQEPSCTVDDILSAVRTKQPFEQVSQLRSLIHDEGTAKVEYEILRCTADYLLPEQVIEIVWKRAFHTYETHDDGVYNAKLFQSWILHVATVELSEAPSLNTCLAVAARFACKFDQLAIRQLVKILQKRYNKCKLLHFMLDTTFAYDTFFIASTCSSMLADVSEDEIMQVIERPRILSIDWITVLLEEFIDRSPKLVRYLFDIHAESTCRAFANCQHPFTIAEWSEWIVYLLHIRHDFENGLRLAGYAQFAYQRWIDWHECFDISATGDFCHALHLLLYELTKDEFRLSGALPCVEFLLMSGACAVQNNHIEDRDKTFSDTFLLICKLTSWKIAGQWLNRYAFQYALSYESWLMIATTIRSGDAYEWIRKNVILPVRNPAATELSLSPAWQDQHR